MRILIAGATGVLGSRLTARLRMARHAVVGTTRSRERFGLIEAAGGEPVVMDALDREAVHDVVAGVRPDVIVHELTDLTGFDFAASDRLRVEGTPNLVDAALAAGVGRMIAQSISWTYEPADDPARESEPFAVDAVTGEHPHAPVEVLEREVARMPVGTVLRYGLFYGPGTWYAADGAYTRKAAVGEVVATADNTSWVHVDDAVDATVLALDWPSGPVNVVDDEPCRLADWGPVLARRAGFEGAPSLTPRAPGRAADNGLARSRGWVPAHPDWRPGLGLG
jgi:nucleoside-diphosphate-sugar epimerase